MSQVSFKKRNLLKIKKLNFFYGDISFTNFKKIQFEYIYFYCIKKFLKYLYKYKYSSSTSGKCWVFLKGNFPITKKGKNARMGKGKGKFVRWGINLNHGHTIMEFKNVHESRLLKLNKYWNALLNFKLLLRKKN